MSLKQFGFDDNEHETLKMMRDGKRLAAPRQLGDWITIEIDATKKMLRAIANDATHTQSAIGCACWKYCSLMPFPPATVEQSMMVLDGTLMCFARKRR